MATKLKDIQDLYDKSVAQINKSVPSWKGFLTTAAWMYKYTFVEQALIHAQRPDATACAEYDIWQKMGRYVKRNATGIALLSKSAAGQAKLRYVFDVTDTGGAEEVAKTALWRVSYEKLPVILAALTENFGTEENTLSKAVKQIADNKADGMWERLKAQSEERYPEKKYPDELLRERKNAFVKTVSASIQQIVLTRCDIASGIEDSEFKAIKTYNAPGALETLYNSVKYAAETILYAVEKAVKQYDREQQERSEANEQATIQPNVQARRGISDPGLGASERAGRDIGEILRPTPEIPDGELSSGIRTDETGGEPVRTSGEYQRGRLRQDRPTPARSDEIGGINGIPENARPNEVGRSDEQLRSIGGGSDIQRTDISAPGNAEHVRTDNERIAEKAESEKPSAFLSEDAIIGILENAYYTKGHGKVRTRAFFSENNEANARIAFAKEAFSLNVFSGVKVNDVLYGYQAKEDEMLLWAGNYLTRTAESHLSWGEIARHMERMGERPEANIADATHGVQLPQEKIDHVLRMGGNNAEYHSIVIAELSKNRHFAIEELEELLKKTCKGGNGLVIDGEKLSAWYAPDGIRLCHGTTARYTPMQTLSWEDAAKRIIALMESGEYATQEEIEAAPGEERMRIAQKLWFISRDMSDAAHDADYFRELKQITHSGGFPEETKAIAEYIADAAGCSIILQELKHYYDACKEDETLCRFGITLRTIPGTIDALAELGMERKYTPAQPIQQPDVERFITDDEINACITDHIPVSGGESRVYLYFTENPTHTAAEKSEFLKDEYGTSGYCDGSYNVWCDATGYKIDKAECESVKLTWKNAAERVTKLVNENHFARMAPIPQTETPVASPATQTEHIHPISMFEYMDTVKKDAPAPMERKPAPPYFMQATYRLLNEIAPEIINGTASYVKLESDGYMPLIIERLYKNRISIAHNYVQYGDLMADPDMEFTLDPESQTMSARTYQQDNLGKYQTVEGVNGEIDNPRLAKELNTFSHTWFKNIKQQGFVKTREVAELRGSDVEIKYDKQGKIIEVKGEPEIVNEYVKQHNIPISAIAAEPTPQRESEPAEQNVSSFEYKLLDRLRADCEYYLGAGNKDETHLWAGTPAAQIAKIRELYALLPQKPEWLTLQAIDDYETRMTHEAVPSNARNYRISNEHLGNGTKGEKYQNNINAIRLLKEIEAENRQATPEEQEVLAQYVGWGGLPECFEEKHVGYAELKTRLTDEEYAAARASTLNAHYTSPEIIKAMYNALSNMGFHGGAVLEPSCGTGHYFGMLPEDAMSQSRLYGVELDSITGRIAQQLYPKANITVQGFEKTDNRDFYDLVVGNVPFGNYKVADRAYDRYGFMIHDYFIAKSIDQARPGGIVALITSKGTMDKRTPDVRRYYAERAELLGAVRLPNNAFKDNAGTEVTSDILFFRKREQPIVIEPEWVHTETNEDGIAINSYFAEHPEMVLGKMTMQTGRFGDEATCEPIPGTVLSEQLEAALSNIKAEYTPAQPVTLSDEEAVLDTLPADPNVKNYSYTVIDGNVYYRENSLMMRKEMPNVTQARIKELVVLRDCAYSLLNSQLYDDDADTIAMHQRNLNTLYDGYVERYGRLLDRGTKTAFRLDASYPLLTSLEIYDDEHNYLGKAPIFTRRTIRQHQAITHADTASDALTLSIAEKARVDLPYMAQLTGKTEEQLISELRGVIFLNIGAAQNQGNTYVTADEYLSGNVREKLDMARAAQATLNDGSYDENVKALEQVQPVDLTATEITANLGATWIDPVYVKGFVAELLKIPTWQMKEGYYNVLFSKATSEWSIAGKNSMRTPLATMTYGTPRRPALRIIEDTLNQRDCQVYDTIEEDGKKKRVLNSKETTLATQKQQLIKDAWRDWIWKDADRRHDLVETYNRQFNSLRPREYDGSNIAFVGMTPDIEMHTHQKNAVAHQLYGGNTLLAHEVGSGKTFEMVAAAMEGKRLGLCTKSLLAVPNHLTEQWGAEFLRLYPGANILVTTKRDFEKQNRKRFCSRIATGDYDAIIMGHTQFEKIGVSKERQEALLRSQIDEIMDGIEELKSEYDSGLTVKGLERVKKSLEVRLEKLLETETKDDVITFEQLGVDRLFVDEAHNYKNLFLYTKMQNVAGLSTSDAQKSADMFAKCRYMDEITDGKGVVFATGTPVSNSMTEVYTMQRYLQYSTLERMGLVHFDCWAGNFGETTTQIELAPEGTGYRARTRFARFYNLPELMSIFREVADIKTSDQLDLNVPKANYHTIVAQPTEEQKAYIKELSNRASAVHNGIDPSIDNMLKITSDGRKLGLDQRIINPLLPDAPGSKLNLCVENVLRIWRETEEKKSTQLIFSDISTPKNDGSFNVYNDIREKLIQGGMPESEIAFIHDANTDTAKADLFAKVRSGKVRVLLGSTQKMGAGTNVQNLLVASHDLDCPWRPSDLTQRAGRTIRQGNTNPEVDIYRYVTDGTFDAYLWQTVETKQRFISQIMTSKKPVRVCEDADETALSYAEIKALCAGNPHIKEKMQLDIEVAQLRLAKSEHNSQQYRLEDAITREYPTSIKNAEEKQAGYEQDAALAAEYPLPLNGFVGMEIGGTIYTERAKAGAAILNACKSAKEITQRAIGSYRGFALSIEYYPYKNQMVLYLQGRLTHGIELGTDAVGNITRTENLLKDLSKSAAYYAEKQKELKDKIVAAKAELGKPFPLEAELAEKTARLAELDVLLNMDEKKKTKDEPER